MTAQIHLLLRVMVTVLLGLIATAIGVYLYLAAASANDTQCLNSGMFANHSLDILASGNVNGKIFELARYRSGFEDKVDILVLYPKLQRQGNCIPLNAEVSMKQVDYGPEEQQNRWPVQIEVHESEFAIEYSDDPERQRALSRIPVIWP